MKFFFGVVLLSSCRMDYNSSSPVCVLCNTIIDGVSVTVRRGLTKIIDVSKQRGNVEIYEKLNGRASVEVHEDCRKNYTRQSTIEAVCKSSQLPSEPLLYSPVKKKLRTSEEIFEYKTHCLIYGKLCLVEMQKKFSHDRCDVI